MPSSTSSSEVPYRYIPMRSWGLAWLVGVSFLALAITGWEMQARSMQHVPGGYDEYANFVIQWAEERRKLDAPDADTRVVLLGSSRMLWGADLDILEDELGTRPVQLAIAGTSPSLMFKDMVENTTFDGVAVIGVTTFLFNRLDGDMFGNEALDWYQGAAPSAQSGYQIHSFLSRYFGFIDDGFKLFQLLDHYSDFPERDGALELESMGWKLGEHYADRQTDLWAPVEVEGSFDNEQNLAFWRDGLIRPPEPPEEMAELAQDTAAFFAPLVARLRARGGDAVFIRMPSSGLYLDHDLATNYRELTWAPMAEAVDALWINTMDYPELSTELEIPEWSHLSRRSQDDFSRRLPRVLEREYLRLRGQSIQQVLDLAGPGE